MVKRCGAKAVEGLARGTVIKCPPFIFTNEPNLNVVKAKFYEQMAGGTLEALLLFRSPTNDKSICH